MEAAAAERAIVIDYRAHDSARPFHESSAQVKALVGPAGSGKSLCAMWEFVLLCREATSSMRGVVIRETQQQINDSYMRTWNKWFGDVSRFEKQHDRIHLTIPGLDGVWRTHELDLRQCRRVEDATKFLSTEYAFFHLEEVVPGFDASSGVIGAGLPEGLFKMCLLRQRQSEAHRLHIVLTFNPPNTFHWTYRTFYKPSVKELERRGYALFRMPPGENKGHLPPGYYQQLREQLADYPDMLQRFVDGEAVTVYPGVRVYPEVRESIHMRSGLVAIPGLPLITAHDFGRTPAILIAQNVPPGRLVIYREMQLWDMGATRAADELGIVLADEFPGLKWGRGWGDPSGADTRSETDDSTSFGIFAAKGYPLRAGALTFTARKEGVKQRATRNFDGEPALLIDKDRCPWLCQGLLGGYRYPKSPDGQIGPRPMKNEFSHTVNGLEYLATGEFNVVDGAVRSGMLPKQLKIPEIAPLRGPRPRHGRRGNGRSWMVH